MVHRVLCRAAVFSLQRSSSMESKVHERDYEM
jgi:hypothetical protein